MSCSSKKNLVGVVELKLAISGKGGVGKTTVASVLAKLFAQDGRQVYAIDADPDACLAAGLGIALDAFEAQKPLVAMKTVVDAREGGDGAFFSLNPKVDDLLEEYCIEQGNIRFMRMSGMKNGGEACFCRENTFLSAVVGALLLDKNDVVIMDMGAGIEHLSRGTARGVDLMLVVVEPSRNSVNTARAVYRMAQDLGIQKVKVVANKIRTEKDRAFIATQFNPEDIVGFINFDDAVWASAMDDAFDQVNTAQLYDSISNIRSKIVEEVGER